MITVTKSRLRNGTEFNSEFTIRLFGVVIFRYRE